MVGAVVVALLYFTREILIPIALAVLLSFVLAPLVRLLQGLRLPRSLAVISAVATAFVIAAGLAAMVVIEVNQLGNDLPRYESTLSDKVKTLRDTVGLLKNASSMLQNLDRDLKAKDQGEIAAARNSLTDGTQSKALIPVEVHQPDPGASETLAVLLTQLAVPFTTQVSSSSSCSSFSSSAKTSATASSGSPAATIWNVRPRLSTTQAGGLASFFSRNWC
jgi:predicted PurR-regulated permease PerM